KGRKWRGGAAGRGGADFSGGYTVGTARRLRPGPAPRALCAGRTMVHGALPARGQKRDCPLGEPHDLHGGGSRVQKRFAVFVYWQAGFAPRLGGYGGRPPAAGSAHASV